MKQGWEIKKLGECFEYIKNGANIKQERGAGGIPITRIETLSGGVFNRDRLGYADIETIDKYQSYVMESGDLLLSHINSKSYIGRVVVYVKEGNETIIHGMNLLRLKVIPDIISPFYMYYYSQTHKFKSQIATRRKDAVNQSSISVTDLKTIDVPVPPREEQERIVEELDCLSGVIEKKREQLRELDALAQSIFYTMFGDPITNEKGWEVKKLKNITSKIGSGATPKGGNESYKGEGISLIRSLNIHNNLFVYKDLAHIDEEQADALRNVVVEDGDVLLNITGASVARCCVVPNDVLPARVNQHVAIIRPKELGNNIFICYQFTSNAYQQELLSIGKSNGATREALTKGQLEELDIIVPPLTLQQEFADKIEAIEEQKELIKQSITETEELFNARMDYYFN